ncbi:unnamed protein product [Microthlaspi erraticum]|uniref:Pentacotripeptide-repeat region of PRORP domain-containing protein n=1 Tax=Microthlaspi erraticum TaxID=1685480 RepID=A0A6D2L297_9BRAS|nr:unnamed protein product [Microthlaspi erraticum]
MSSSLIRRILHPTRKPKPDSTISISLFTTVSSPPSDHSNPLISDVVSVLTHHRSKSRWSTLRSLHPSGFTPFQFSEITLRLRNNAHLSLRFFLFTRRYSLCSHDVDSCSTLVHILARSRLKTHARELIRLSLRLADDDEDKETDRVSRVFRSLIKSYNRCGSAPFVFDLLVKSCLDSKEIDGAVMVMRKLRSKGINLQISTCNALISEASKRRDASTGYKLYREVFGLDHETRADEAKKLKPYVNTFNLMMVSFYREGETEIVEKIWREMEEEGCSPNAYSYNVLMETYCSRGMMMEAEKIWEEMKLKRLELDVVAYNTMIGGLCRNLEVTKAMELCKEMRLKKGIECTSLTYDHLVKGYCKAGDVDSAMVVYKEMKRKSFEAEGLTIEALVDGLCGGDDDEGRVVDAAEIVKEAVEFYPSRKCYELLVKRLCEVGKMERALKIQAEMVGRGFKPSGETYKAFINGYGSVGDEETSALLAIEMADALKLRGEDDEEEEELQ